MPTNKLKKLQKMLEAEIIRERKTQNEKQLPTKSKRGEISKKGENLGDPDGVDGKMEGKMLKTIKVQTHNGKIKHAQKNKELQTNKATRVKNARTRNQAAPLQLEHCKLHNSTIAPTQIDQIFFAIGHEICSFSKMTFSILDTSLTGKKAEK